MPAKVKQLMVIPEKGIYLGSGKWTRDPGAGPFSTFPVVTAGPGYDTYAAAEKTAGFEMPTGVRLLRVGDVNGDTVSLESVRRAHAEYLLSPEPTPAAEFAAHEPPKMKKRNPNAPAPVPVPAPVPENTSTPPEKTKKAK